MSSHAFDRAAFAAAQQALAAKERQIEKLKAENGDLKGCVRKLQTQLKRQQTKKEKKEPSPDQTATQVSDFLASFGGFSRLTLFSDEWHAQHPTAANQLFAFSTWDICKQSLIEKFPDEFGSDALLQAQCPQIGFHAKKKKFHCTSPYDGVMINERAHSELEQALCVRLCHRMAMSVGRASLIFDVHARTIQTWKQKWIPKWGFSPDEVPCHQSRPMIPSNATSGGSGKGKRKRDDVNDKHDSTQHVVDAPNNIPQNANIYQHPSTNQNPHANLDYLANAITLDQMGGESPRWGNTNANV